LPERNFVNQTVDEAEDKLGQSYEDVKKGLADPSDDETEERDMVEQEETSREYDRREQERREEERNSQPRLAEETTDRDEPVHRPEGQDKDFDEGNKRS